VSVKFLSPRRKYITDPHVRDVPETKWPEPGFDRGSDGPRATEAISALVSKYRLMV